jgi:hypothetical protein
LCNLSRSIRGWAMEWDGLFLFGPLDSALDSDAGLREAQLEKGVNYSDCGGCRPDKIVVVCIKLLSYSLPPMH